MTEQLSVTEPVLCFLCKSPRLTVFVPFYLLLYELLTVHWDIFCFWLEMCFGC